jgi:hypothetical protein
VEPFEGQKADDQPFLAVFERLHHSPQLTVPTLLINVLAPVGAVPKGVDWNLVGERVIEWFHEIRLNIPVGESDYKIPGVEFDLNVHIEVMEIPDSPGVLVVGRLLPKDKPFSDVLRAALKAKLPKLASTTANRHILLVEDGSIILGFVIFSREIDAARADFRELDQIDSVWLAHTPVWEREKVVWFVHVWPNGVGDRFEVKDL